MDWKYLFYEKKTTDSTLIFYVKVNQKKRLEFKKN